MYQANSHSCYLYLGSIIVDEFGPYPINHAGLIAMTESFVQVSFALLSTNTGLIDNPDTVDDMFRLCARCNTYMYICTCTSNYTLCILLVE